MKYALRTVTWRFHHSSEPLPALHLIPHVVIQGPEDLFKAYRSLFTGHVKERFAAFWLSSSNKVLGFEVITEGTLNASLTHPREIFRGAIVATAAAIIVAHNHPSGNGEPSPEDIAVTKQLVDAGKVIGIPVHDHIIFTDEGYTSLAERGLMT